MSDADRAAAAARDRGHRRVSGDVPVLMLDIPPATFEAALQRDRELGAVVRSAPALRHAEPAALRPRFRARLGRLRRVQRGLRRRPGPAGQRRTAPGPHPGLSPGARPEAGAGPAARRADRALLAHPVGAPGLLSHAPRRRRHAILDGMLGADHLGFLAGRWADAFLDCCAEVLGAEVQRPAGSPIVAAPPPSLSTRSALTPSRCGSVPSRDDVQSHKAALPRAVRRPPAHREGRPDRAVQEHRAGLAAFRELLATLARMARAGHPPGLRLPVALVDPPEYQAYTEKVRQTAQEINEQFATPDWKPVVLEVKDDYARSLAACCRRRRAADQPDQGRHEPGRRGGPDPQRARLRARPVPRGRRGLPHRRRGAPGQPLRHLRHGHGPAGSPLPAGSRAPPRSAAIASAASGAAPAKWLAAQLEGLA